MNMDINLLFIVNIIYTPDIAVKVRFCLTIEHMKCDIECYWLLQCNLNIVILVSIDMKNSFVPLGEINFNRYGRHRS